MNWTKELTSVFSSLVNRVRNFTKTTDPQQLQKTPAVHSISESDAPASNPPPSPLPGGGGTILVIDDDESVRELLQRLLEQEGYTVLTAEDGNTGLGNGEKTPSGCHHS